MVSYPGMHAYELLYGQTAVRERISEFCLSGDQSQAGSATRYFVGYGIDSARDDACERKEYFPSHRLDDLLCRGFDCARSLWDRQNSVAVLDVDYQNVDFPGEAFLNPQITYAKLEPVYQSITLELRSLGIDHLATITGKGYHFVWRIPDDHRISRRLRRLGRPTRALLAKYARTHDTAGEPVPLEKGQAFAGVGLLMEYLTHRIIRRARESSVLPVVTTGLAVGSSITGREAISIDLAAHGDPLHLRDFRSPFSRYQKHHIQRRLVGDEVVSRVPLVVCLPRVNVPLRELLRIRTNAEAAGELARVASTQIPDGSAGMSRLLYHYERSDLVRFHQHFHEAAPLRDEASPSWDEHLDVHALPSCAAVPLCHPNDWLLKPTYVQVLCRVLWAVGWEPRHIADLVRSRYQIDDGWGDTWELYDAGTRADFWVRIMIGMIVDGTDDLMDFNCVSQAEKGYCPRPYCGHNLAVYHDMLRERLS